MSSSSGQDSSEPGKWVEEVHIQRSENSTIESVSRNSLDIAHDYEKALTPQISRASQPSLRQKVTSVGTAGTTDPNFEVDWEDEDDPANPRNWSLAYRSMMVGFLSWNTFIVVLYSTSYTAGIANIASDLNASQTVVTLGLTLYLIGLAVGSVIIAPLSETYGRKPISVICMFLMLVLIIPAALATSVAELLVVRLIGAFAGSAMIASAPGTLADIVDDEHRALAFSVWSLGPLNGPVFGPIIGGFVTQYLGWRWTDWIVMMMTGVALMFSCIMKETYTPVLLQRKAARIRKETDDPRWWSRYDQKVALSEVLKINLTRPFIMAVVEPICIFWNIYIAIVYAILYLCFVAYPIVFRDIRGWSVGLSGLAFIGIGVGSILTIVCEPLIRRLINRHKVDPETGRVPSEAMVSFVCIAAVLIPIGELWFAWTCSPASIHWAVPIVAGVPFGAGNTGVFIYATNYLTHSYGIYAASALAGNAVIRSILGGVLPLAGPYMYASLGANWAGTLLGLMEVAIIPIPIIFYKYGYKIRQKSTLIQMMQDDKKKLEGKRQLRRDQEAAAELREAQKREEV
ncbi:hypothetical protein DTO166G4_4830 [Paecilomyces variotii]|nr:hypothetical protein DTO166G4_4830 [Paecilomyces variotii]KAJ9240487.1 hypothetical protein DTO166G5_1825 [Paecilomyces variotii]KAJ9411166.1 hypothetical protein DTO045G8_798 [Paecilomyces variotii]